MSEFSEDSRVKFPALIHLVGMDYEYISSNNSAKAPEEQEPFDPLTNILVDRFKAAFLRLNPKLTEEGQRRRRLPQRQKNLNLKRQRPRQRPR